MKKDLTNLVPTIVGTAGHIDHGKSSMVKRLTGIDPDRLVEEQKRGMTIDIGFAEIQLPSGKLIGFVDVPGHERFIKNMVAGASGFGIVLFVVAADDGIMPQSIEHLHIMDMLGVKQGIIVLNKIDLLDDPDLGELIGDDIRDTVKGTFLEDAEIIEFSAITGQGIEQLTDALEKMLNLLEIQESKKLFRMPIQRVFSAVGFGSVVTGVPSDGEISVGEEIEILSSKDRQSTKIRGMQVFGQNIPQTQSGHRLALNLQGISTDYLNRGNSIVFKGAYRTAKIISAKINILKSFLHSVKNTLQISVFIGTGRFIGKLILLSGEKFLNPGDSALVQIRFDEPIPACPDDRFIIRDFSNQFLIGGGRILKITDEKPRGKKQYFMSVLEKIEKAIDSPRDFLGILAEDLDFPELSEKTLKQELGYKPEFSRKLLKELETAKIITNTGTGYISTNKFTEYKNRLLEIIESENITKAFKFWHSKAHLLSRLKAKSNIGETVLKILASENQIVIEKGRIQLFNYIPKLNDEQQDIADKVLDEIQKTGVTPKLAFEFERDWGISDADDILNYWVDMGEIVQINQTLFVTKDVHEIIIQAGVDVLANVKSFTVSTYREAVGTTRKFAMPYLAYIDSLGITRLEDGERIRGSKYDAYKNRSE